MTHSALISSILNRDEEGQGLAEYALILALIAIVAIVALIFLGGQVDDLARRHPSQQVADVRDPHSPSIGDRPAARLGPSAHVQAVGGRSRWTASAIDARFPTKSS